MAGVWVSPETKNAVISAVDWLHGLTGLPVSRILTLAGIFSSRFHAWKKNPDFTGPNKKVPKSHWLLPEEEKAIVKFKRQNPTCGYRLLAWMMVDANVCFASPSSVLRVLTRHFLNTKWTTPRAPERKKGFKQPTRIHRHWHVDIAYVNVFGTFMFLITVLEGFSRMVLAWGLRTKMEEQDVSQIVYQAHEKYPEAKPALISDNGKQFVAIEFRAMLKQLGISPRLISPGHPQSNGKIERWHRTIKEGEIRVNTYTGPPHAIKQIGDWVNWYNEDRLHSAIGYLPPALVFAGKGEERLNERRKKLVDARARRREIRSKKLA